MLVISGPDGSGKSSLADAVEARFSRQHVRRFHHRPGVLPRRSQSTEPVTEPHADPPYGRALSLAKSLYLFADFVLGWWFVIAPLRRRETYVILERGWFDVAVDRRRYRLAVPAAILSALGRVLPPPDLHVVLDAPATAFYERKRELPIEEIERQSRAWRALAAAGKAVLLDATLPIDVLADDVCNRMRRGHDAHA